MDKIDAQAYLNRWRAVDEIHQQEATHATLELRWQQLNAAYGLSKSLLLTQVASEETRVQQRWAKLKENLQPIPKA